jgi:hypothetical protein
MTDKFKTYVITNPTQTSFSFSLDSNDFTGYDGFLYLLMGSGGNGGSRLSVSYGGSSGFVNAGYIDLNYPYNVREINITMNPSSATTLAIGYTGPNYDPTNGQDDFILSADQGQAFEVQTSPTTAYMVTGLYAPSNQFNSQTNGGNPYLINQRGIDSSQGSSGPFNGQGGLTNDFCIYQSSPLNLGGGGFYGGTVGSSGPTGPFGFASGGWFNSSTGTNGTLGYAIITLIPSSSVQNTQFLTGNTGTIGNTGLYLYSLLGGGGGGNGSGGGSGDVNFGFINSSSALQYSIGLGGTAGFAGGSTTISNDNYISTITAIGGSTNTLPVNAGGDGFFAGGTIGPNPAYGQSYINIPNNITNSTIGTGFVNTNYGQGSTFGGGGGPYGGNSVDYGGVNAQGYGCGGGGAGQFQPQGVGTGGYAILKQLTPNCFTYRLITSNTTISRAELFGYVGFWGFLESPVTITQLDISRNYFNVFHFLIRDDNVQEIDIVKDIGNFFNVSISFSKLNNKTQLFNMKATHPSTYMYMIFYI